MPYKNKEKQRKAVREAVARHKAKQKKQLDILRAYIQENAVFRRKLEKAIKEDTLHLLGGKPSRKPKKKKVKKNAKSKH